MKIALTVKGAGLGAWLDDDFAHCGHVMVVEEGYQFTSWINPDKESVTDGAENLLNSIILEDVDFLVTGKISTSEKEILVKAGVKVIENKDGAVLNLLDEISNT